MLALVLEGGGLRAGFVAGALMAMMDLGLRNFDIAVAVSASVPSLAYFLSGRREVRFGRHQNSRKSGKTGWKMDIRDRNLRGVRQLVQKYKQEFRCFGCFQFRAMSQTLGQAAETVHDQQHDFGVCRLQQILNAVEIHFSPPPL